MWVDHFLLPAQFSAIHAHNIGKVTYMQMSVIILRKLKSVEASIRRKLQKQKEKEEEELKKEAETFKLFM